MRSSAKEQKAAHRGEPVILFGIGDNMFAISAASVDEIRDTQGLQQIATAAIAKVRYRLLRDGRTYYVVDGNLYFRILPSHATRVLVLRNSRAAVLVSHIDRMTEISNVAPLPHAFLGEERNWYRGLAVLNPESDTPSVVPVVNSDTFVSPAEMELLQSGEPRKQGRAAARMQR